MTHSVASLHLGFLDAGFCGGKLEFIKVSPHDYSEGQMRAPLGAQVKEAPWGWRVLEEGPHGPGAFLVPHDRPPFLALGRRPVPW